MNNLFFVQIITESLPISSSGHLAFLLKAFPLLQPLSFYENLIAHFPTLCILAISLGQYLIRWFRYHPYKRLIQDTFVIGIATGITSLGVAFIHYAKTYTSFHIPLWYGFLITATLLLYSKTSIQNMGYREFLTIHDGVWLGLAQSCALAPGISRFGITLLAALFLGMEYRYAFLVSCALQAALCAGGTFLALIAPYYSSSLHAFASLTIQDGILIFLSSFISLVFFFIVIQYYLKNKLWIFGVYLSILAFVSLFFG